MKEWDNIVFPGNVELRDFLAFYVKDSRIRAVAGMNRDREMAVWEEKMRANRVLSSDQLSNGRAETLDNATDSSRVAALRLL